MRRRRHHAVPLFTPTDPTSVPATGRRPAAGGIVVPATAILLFALASCRAGGDTGSDVTVRDSAGVTIVENPQMELDRILGTSVEPIVEIGVVDGAPEYQFGRVTGAARLSDGRIVVADWMAREVRWYGPRGEHLLTFGQEGQGPEDFTYPSGVLPLPGDTVLVQDRWDPVRLGPRGSFVDRERFDRGGWVSLWEPNFSEGFEWLADGTLFAPVYERVDRQPPAGPPFRPAMTLVRVSGDFSSVDTLGSFGGVEQQYVEVGGQQGVRPIVPPFAVNTSWSTAPDGTIAVGDSRHPQVHLFRSDGAHRIVRWADDPEPLTSADVEAWKERQRNASWTRNQLPELERGWAEMELPEHKARFYWVNVTRDGGVWVALEEYSSKAARWLVFDSEGRWRGLVSLPGPFRVEDVGADYVLGVYRDENDVEYVRMYALEEESGRDEG